MTNTTAAIVARQIKKELKEIGVKSQVTSKNFSMGNSVDIYVDDLSPEKFAEVQKICMKYQLGHFDGMTDSYEYSNVANNLVGQVKYVNITNFMSIEISDAITSWIRKKDIHNQFRTDEDVQKFFNDCGMHRSNLIRKIFRGNTSLLGDFWADYNKEQSKEVEPEVVEDKKSVDTCICEYLKKYIEDGTSAKIYTVPNYKIAEFQLSNNEGTRFVGFTDKGDRVDKKFYKTFKECMLTILFGTENSEKTLVDFLLK